MIDFFSEGQIKELRRAFSSVDTHGRGVVASCDLGFIMRQLGHVVTDEEAVIMMGGISEDSGKITFPDFLTLMSIKMRLAITEKIVQEAFDVLDVNGNGVIEVKELEKSMTGLGDKLSPEEYQELVRAMGIGLCGQVSFNDFRNIITDI